jgi:acetyl esterase/lipase
MCQKMQLNAFLAVLTVAAIAAIPARAADCINLGSGGRAMLAEGGAAAVPSGADVRRDIAYGNDPAQRLDVYSLPGAHNAPVILMVHGGGWRLGDKASSRVIENKVGYWVPKGYIFVSVNYRFSPQANPVEEANDIAKALAFAQAQAVSWGGDSARFVLMGHSAGAHLVSMLAADPAIAAKAGAKPWLGTVSLDSAAYDMVSIMENRHFCLYDDVFGSDRSLWAAASPTLIIKAAPAPMLLVCSTRRSDSCSQADAFATKANGLGGKVIVLPEDLTHMQINANLGAAGDYTDKVEAFMRALGLN